MSWPRSFLCLLPQRQTASWKYRFFCAFFFLFSEYSLIFLCLSSQIESSRAFSSWLCTPISALFVTTMNVIYLRRSPYIQKADLFPGTFWDGPLLGLFTLCYSCYLLHSLYRISRGFGGPLCRFLESVDYSCRGFTNGICDNSQFCFCNIFSRRSTRLGIQIKFLKYGGCRRCLRSTGQGQLSERLTHTLSTIVSVQRGGKAATVTFGVLFVILAFFLSSSGLVISVRQLGMCFYSSLRRWHCSDLGVMWGDTEAVLRPPVFVRSSVPHMGQPSPCCHLLTHRHSCRGWVAELWVIDWSFKTTSHSIESVSTAEDGGSLRGNRLCCCRNLQGASFPWDLIRSLT